MFVASLTTTILPSLKRSLMATFRNSIRARFIWHICHISSDEHACIYVYMLCDCTDVLLRTCTCLCLFVCIICTCTYVNLQGGAASNTKAILERARGKVLLIDEAYVLDPRRKNNIYGGNVLDTLVEKLDGEAGSDIAVILAGYKQEMFDMLDNNPGLRRRFAIDDFGMHFTDMGDEELKQVLVSTAAKAGLAFENLDLIDAVVAHVAQKRRMPGFGNAATVNSMLNVAKTQKAARLDQAQRDVDKARRQGDTVPLHPDPDVLVRSDFIPEEVDADKARDIFDGLYNTEHIMQELDSLEALIMAAKDDGREPADILADAHMVFVGPPGTGKTTVANRFGKLFKDLDVLPSDTVTVVTGTSLMGQVRASGVHVVGGPCQ